MRKLRRKIKKIAKKLVPVLGFIPVVGTGLSAGVVVAKIRRNAKDEKIAARLQAVEVSPAVQDDNAPTLNKVEKFFAPVADFFGQSNTGTPAAGTSPLKPNKLPLLIIGALVLGLLGFLYMRKR